MNFHQQLVRDYTDVRARLGAAPLMPVIMLRAPAQVLYLPPPEPQGVCDPIPNQRGVEARHIQRISAEAELIATRRALAGFARLRTQYPVDKLCRHLKMAVAAAFKVDAGILEHPSRCQGAVRIRHITLMIACHVCDLSRYELGRRFNRDHSTIYYANLKMEWLLDGASCQIGDR
jgi:hypothetical protein